MSNERVTPLQPREFFRGEWRGRGELVPNILLRWLLPRQEVRFRCASEWLSERFWLIRKRLEFSSGHVIERKLFAELAAPDRIHLTADDLPLGTDVTLHENGFRFAPYYLWSGLGGRRWLLRCRDSCEIDGEGRIRDVIRIYYHGFPVAVMTLEIRAERPA